MRFGIVGPPWANSSIPCVAENGSSEERSHQATGRRLQKARESGQVAQSRDINGVIVFWAAAGLLIALNHSFVTQWKVLFEQLLQAWPVVLEGRESIGHTFPLALLLMGKCLLPFLSAVVIFTVIPTLCQTRFLITFQPISLDFSKVDPKSGLGRLFSSKSLWDCAKTFIKLMIVLGALWHTLQSLLSQRDLLMTHSSTSLFVQVGHFSWIAFKNVGIWMLVFAAADYVLEHRRLQKQLMMSRHELKEELKETDGNPRIKSKWRALRRKRQGKPLRKAVPQATLVVTNPTHLAVAIHYEAPMRAPVVVAKGADLRARTIRQLALDHHIPMMENKPLARLLYRQVDVDDEIPSSLFQAVAELLAAVYRLRIRKHESLS